MNARHTIYVVAAVAVSRSYAKEDPRRGIGVGFSSSGYKLLFHHHVFAGVKSCLVDQKRTTVERGFISHLLEDPRRQPLGHKNHFFVSVLYYK